MYRRCRAFLPLIAILCSLLAFYALFNCLILTPQPAIAQTGMTTSPQSTKVIMEDSIQIPHNNAVHLNIADQLIGTSENVVWENFALGSNTTHNIGTSPSKAVRGLSPTNTSNCT